MRILNQGIHTFLYDKGVRVIRENYFSSAEKTDLAKAMGLEI